MRFSVITITLNAEAYLEKCLASVAAQRFSSFEHIVWDGGSTDQTLNILSRFPHITLHQGKDKGIADALNKASALASGDYLIHLHADDELAHPHVFSYMDLFFKQHPVFKWAYGQIATMDEQGTKTGTSRYHPFDLKQLRKYNTISHPATFIERKLFIEEGGFNPSLRYCMDYDLWLRLAKKTPPHALPAILSHFRQHQGSLSTREALAVADEAYKVRHPYMRNVYERWRSYRTWKRRRHSELKKCPLS